MTSPPALATSIDGRRYRLPDGAVALGAQPVILPLPGSGLPLLGLAVHGGEVLPVFAPATGPHGPSCWALLPLPTPLLLGVATLMEAMPGDAPLPRAMLLPGPARPRVTTTVLPGSDPGTVQTATPGRAAQTGALRLGLGRNGGLDLPMAVILQIVSCQTMVPVPGGPAGALGYVGTIAGDALVLDPIPLGGGEAAAESALLVVFVLDGLCLALPCDRVGPGDAAAAVLLCARLADPAQRAARDAAPRARKSQAAAVPMRQVLVAMAGGMRFALPAGAVIALLPPQYPAPPPPGAPPMVRGLCVHRGNVLPVVDVGRQLGGTAAAADVEARPLLRLDIVPPVAILVDGLPTLHHLPEAEFTPNWRGGWAGGQRDQPRWPAAAALPAGNPGVVPSCGFRRYQPGLPRSPAFWLQLDVVARAAVLHGSAGRTQ